MAYKELIKNFEKVRAYMPFSQTPEGKNVFLSVGSRITCSNPFYKLKLFLIL